MLTDDRDLLGGAATSGDRVNLVGWLTVDPDCFAEDIQAEGQCEPIGGPVYVNIVELERESAR